MNKPIGVIILNWNGADLIKDFLPSVLIKTNHNIADIIVADNGSTDNSIEVLTDEFPEIKLIQFQDNYGFAEGYNKAIEMCDYKYIVLLNSDVAVPNGWLEPLYEHCEVNDNVAACQPKILSHTFRSYFEYAGASGGFIDKHGYPFCRGRIFSEVEEDKGQYENIIDIFWASGAALFVRREVYIKAGGLDKEFFAHMEEIDLCWRIHLLGYDIRVVPKSQVYHLGGGSLPASNPRKTYLNFRNNLILLYKNIPAKDRGKLLIIRRLYDTLAMLVFIAKLDFSNAFAVIKAHNDYRKMKTKYTSCASAKMNLLKTFDQTNRNIILDFYIKRNKHF
ncbi:MAG: glycosyltransferase family 2 protein [Muribaculaceae bacterium]|nr:glycosyltransferase family 2 protein [Muribaculaceae bacterium]